MNRSLSATLKYALASEKKMELIAKLVRGKGASEVVTFLQHTPKKGAKLMLKVLKSAIANAVNNQGIKETSLYVAKVDIGKGPKIKRVRFAARSRVTNYNRYRSFVRVILDVK